MSRPEIANRQLYSRSEFCRAYGIGQTTFHKLVNTGALVAVKMFGRTMVTAEDAEAWRGALPRITPTFKTKDPTGGA